MKDFINLNISENFEYETDEDCFDINFYGVYTRNDKYAGDIN